MFVIGSIWLSFLEVTSCHRSIYRPYDTSQAFVRVPSKYAHQRIASNGRRSRGLVTGGCAEFTTGVLRPSLEVEHISMADYYSLTTLRHSNPDAWTKTARGSSAFTSLVFPRSLHSPIW